MNKFLLSVTIGCSLSLGTYAQNREINFKHDTPFSEVLKEAKQNHKIIFFDAYTSWCGPCKVMANTVFKTDSVADFFNQTFVSMKVDMEKGEGPKLKDRFGVSAYPTLLFIDGDGNLVHKIVGSSPSDEFMAEARKALNPEKTVYGLAKRFNSGDHSEATCIAYLSALESAYEKEKMGEVAKVYFDALPESVLLDSKTWELEKRFLTDPSSKAFGYLFNNSAKLSAMYKAGEVESYFNQVFYSTISGLKRAYSTKQNLDVQKNKAAAIEKMLASGTFSSSQKLLTDLHLAQFAGNKQWDQYCGLINSMIKSETATTKKSNASTILWSAMESVRDGAPAKYYETVLKWADHYEQQKENLFAQILVSDLHKMISKKQGMTKEVELYTAKSNDLRKQAAEKRSMTPPLMKD